MSQPKLNVLNQTEFHNPNWLSQPKLNVPTQTEYFPTRTEFPKPAVSDKFFEILVFQKRHWEYLDDVIRRRVLRD